MRLIHDIYYISYISLSICGSQNKVVGFHYLIVKVSVFEIRNRYDYRSDLYFEETEVFDSCTRTLMTYFTQQEMATGLGGQRAFAQKLNKYV